MEQPRSGGNFWPYVAASTLLVILVAAVRWSLDHPYGIHWDESLYLNTIAIDLRRLHSGMLFTLARRLLLDDVGRPPSYRLLSLPFLGLVGLRVTAARIVSLLCYGLSAWFTYRATRCISSEIAGTFAALVFMLSPDIVAASMVYGTDAPLYLATSSMLFYIFAYWRAPQESARHWIGLGLAIGLGFLSKASFVSIVGPVLVFWLVAHFIGKFALPSLWSQWKAGVLAALVSVPWWVLNIRGVIGYSRYARDYVRHSLGPPSVLTWIKWLNTVFQCLVGPGVSVLIILLVIALVIVIMRSASGQREAILEPLEKAAFIACICAGAPIVLVQLSGTNHLLRHISPTIIPLAIVVGMLVDRVGAASSRAVLTVSGGLFAAQLLMLITPVVFPNDHTVNLGFTTGVLPWRTMSRYDQWDWSPVRDLADRCSSSLPKISFLGSGRQFDPPAIQYAWLERTPSKAPTADVPFVKWLWRYEEGPINWQEIMDVSRNSDMVITAPHFVGEVRNREDLDNQNNSEFVNLLSQAPDFAKPVRLEMGRFEPVEVDVFIRKSFGCSCGTSLPPKESP